MKARHVDLFPTRLWVFDFPELAQHFDSWEATILEWRSREPTAGRTNRVGWNSHKTLFDKAEFEPLREAATQACKHAFADMQLVSEPPFHLEGWVNMHDKGGFNASHMHPNVLLSATFYLRVPQGAGPIRFRDPRPGVILVPFPGKGVHCGTWAAMVPTPGQLVVFANWLEHEVEINEADSPRIAIAMNAMAGKR